VQPSVPQREKWRPENQERIFLQHLQLSATSPSGVRDGAAGINLIIWPEAAMPFLPLAAPRALAAIGGMLPRGGHLISGALRVEEPAGAAERRRVYNSLMVFDDQGRLAGLYDKIHLVPFGEYLPLQGWLEAIGLEQLTRIRGGFHSGITPRPLLNLPGTPAFGPLICYEAIFPGEIVQGRDRPAVLVNVTNDGWFGNTTGPRQHLHQARVRAVEEGLPLLRVANNGISAVIDAKGRVLGRLDLDVPGVIDTRVPPALSPPFYARVGDLPFAAAWVLAAAWLSASGLLGRPKRTSG
jgi:apolipoprotein N-acyltransferase